MLELYSNFYAFLPRHLNLPWNPAVLQHEDMNRTIRTSSYLQAKKKINGASVGKWKMYLPALKGYSEQIKLFLDTLYHGNKATAATTVLNHDSPRRVKSKRDNINVIDYDSTLSVANLEVNDL